jgi:hypothetical protein
MARRCAAYGQGMGAEQRQRGAVPALEPGGVGEGNTPAHPLRSVGRGAAGPLAVQLYRLLRTLSASRHQSSAGTVVCISCVFAWLGFRPSQPLPAGPLPPPRSPAAAPRRLSAHGACSAGLPPGGC